MGKVLKNLYGSVGCGGRLVRSTSDLDHQAGEEGADLARHSPNRRDASTQERAASVNGLTKVLLVMQSGCSSGTRQMCVELVKVLRAKSGGIPEDQHLISSGKQLDGGWTLADYNILKGVVAGAMMNIIKTSDLLKELAWKYILNKQICRK
ncbi:ubiquitin-60S ribosomal protein L40 [Striga asiatica]|uniref:Ubiquitin-60S ribosomal protein L40 n=1 Tax=Striga asiatica TaxID=4170 RepID=A0A5A7PJ08_STRAF|nr:ubiquitin-60S ribosomal protein L40 [Striga asiatica]